jgi:hypothetical protein
VFDGRQEGSPILLHIVGDNQRSRLHTVRRTREMPAPQCTSTEPRLISASTSLYFIKWSGKTVRSRPECFNS